MQDHECGFLKRERRKGMITHTHIYIYVYVCRKMQES